MYPSGRKRGIQTVVFLSKEQHARLRGASERTGIPMSSYLRLALDDVLTKLNAPPAPPKEKSA
jgi:hypothetical protein